MQNRLGKPQLERRDLVSATNNEGTNTRQASQSVTRQSTARQSTARVTINEPWSLDIPQQILDHYEQTSALTGIPPSQLIAATIVEQFQSAAVEKKKPSPPSASANRQRSNVSQGRGNDASSLQLLLPFGVGPDPTA